MKTGDEVSEKALFVVGTAERLYPQYPRTPSS